MEIRYTNWMEVTQMFYELPIDQALTILDDGQAHGFEYKVDNGKIYHRFWYY